MIPTRRSIQMSPEQRRALLSETGGREPRLAIRTDTRIDAGRWWLRSPVWVCVTDTHVVLLAVARRRYVESVALSDCRSSFYCHTSGQLMISAGEDHQPRFNRLSMSPMDGLCVLSAMGIELSQSNQSAPTETENTDA